MATDITVVFFDQNKKKETALSTNYRTMSITLALRQSHFLLAANTASYTDFSLCLKRRDGSLVSLDLRQQLSSEQLLYHNEDKDTLHLIRKGSRNLTVTSSNVTHLTSAASAQQEATTHHTSVTKGLTVGEILVQIFKEMEKDSVSEFSLYHHDRSIRLDESLSLEELKVVTEEDLSVSLTLERKQHNKDLPVPIPSPVSPKLDPEPKPKSPTVTAPPCPIPPIDVLSIDSQTQTNMTNQLVTQTSTETVKKLVATKSTQTDFVAAQTSMQTVSSRKLVTQKSTQTDCQVVQTSTQTIDPSIPYHPSRTPSPPVVLKPVPILMPRSEPKVKPAAIIPSLQIDADSGLPFEDMVQHCSLFTVVVMDTRAEHMVLNLDSLVGEAIKVVCAELGLPHSSEWYFYKPNGLEVWLSGTHPVNTALSLSASEGRAFSKTCFTLGSRIVALENLLDSEKTLREVVDLQNPPLILHMRHHNNDVMRGWEDTDGGLLGQAELNAARNVFLSWFRITQGHYPAQQHDVTKVASLLCERKFADTPPISDKEVDDAVASFLPKKYKKKRHLRNAIAGDTKQILSESVDSPQPCTPQEAALKLLSWVEALPAFGGVFFPIQVPGQSKLVKTMKSRLFGIASNEIVVLKYTKSKEEVKMRIPIGHIESFHATKSYFRIKFGAHSADDFEASTSRSFDIMNILKLYIQQHKITVEPSSPDHWLPNREFGNGNQLQSGGDINAIRGFHSRSVDSVPGSGDYDTLRW